MAQEIMVAGAIYEDVPSVRLPDSHGTFHPFTDTSDTTAVAADVAQGKTFHLADGSAATGTAAGATLVTKSITANGTYSAEDDDADGYSEVTVNVSGGGGSAIKMGVLRPDAELWQRFTYDRWIVADEGVTIPAYSTTSQSLKASETIATITDVDTDEYSYYVLIRGLSIPKYVSGTANGKGKQIYHASSYNYELSVSDSQAIAPSGISYSGGAYGTTGSASGSVLVYYSSSWACDVFLGTNASYGCYQQHVVPSLSQTQIRLSSPNLKIRGNATGFTQTYWNALEDIRFQYVFEVYRAPNGGEYFDGFNLQSHLTHTLSCATSASGDLT